MLRFLFLSLIVFLASFSLSASSPSKPALKEKPLPPLGTYYLYIDPTTPRYLIEKALAKKWQVAFLFDQRQAAWLREIIPSLQGTSPVVFLQGTLSPMEEHRLRETLDFFNYEAVLVHIKKKKGETLPALPVKGTLTLEQTTEKGKVVFTLQRGKQPPETATMLSPLDERAFGKPFSVAAGILFPRYGFRFVSIEKAAEANSRAGDRIVVFGAKEKEIEKFIEKW